MVDFLKINQTFQNAMANPLFHSGLGLLEGKGFDQAMTEGMQTAGGIQQSLRQQQQDRQQQEDRQRQLEAQEATRKYQEQFAGQLGLGQLAQGGFLTPQQALATRKALTPAAEEQLTPYQKQQLELERRRVGLAEEEFNTEQKEVARREGITPRGFAGGVNVLDFADKEGLGDTGKRQLLKDASAISKPIIAAATERVRSINETEPYLKKARTALKNFKTGKLGDWRGSLAGGLELVGGDSKEATAYQDLLSFQDRIALGQRKPGSGPMSDKDLQVYQGIGLNVNNTMAYNESYLDFVEATNANDIEYSKFLQAYKKVNQTVEGAGNAWREYVSENPIVSTVDNENGVIINKNREPWQSYFADSLIGIDEKTKKRYFGDYSKEKGTSGYGQQTKQTTEEDPLGIL